MSRNSVDAGRVVELVRLLGDNNLIMVASPGHILTVEARLENLDCPLSCHMGLQRLGGAIRLE